MGGYLVGFVVFILLLLGFCFWSVRRVQRQFDRMDWEHHDDPGPP